MPVRSRSWGQQVFAKLKPWSGLTGACPPNLKPIQSDAARWRKPRGFRPRGCPPAKKNGANQGTLRAAWSSWLPLSGSSRTASCKLSTQGLGGIAALVLFWLTPCRFKIGPAVGWWGTWPTALSATPSGSEYLLLLNNQEENLGRATKLVQRSHVSSLLEQYRCLSKNLVMSLQALASTPQAKDWLPTCYAAATELGSPRALLVADLGDGPTWCDSRFRFRHHLGGISNVGAGETGGAEAIRGAASGSPFPSRKSGSSKTVQSVSQYSVALPAELATRERA